MNRQDQRPIIGVALSFILWYIVFLMEILGSFWYRVTLASLILAVYAYLSVEGDQIITFQAMDALKGIAAGLALYASFFIGFNIFQQRLEGGAASVYMFRSDIPLIVPAVLLLVTSFCEEYFWRFYIQGTMVRKYERTGIVVTSILYAAIHLSTMNLPLTAAALIAGAFWGILYEYTGSLWLVVFSHIVWTEMVFVFLPLL